MDYRDAWDKCLKFWVAKTPLVSGAWYFAVVAAVEVRGSLII